VRAEFVRILRFWLDRGVDGFRIDVAHGLKKQEGLPDIAGRFPVSGPAPEGHPFWDHDDLQAIWREWRAVADAYAGDRTFVGEVWVSRAARLARYLTPGALHTAFNFEFLLAPWDAQEFRAAIDESIGAIASVGAPVTWVLSNHDVIRHVTRYGGGALGLRRARAAALLMLGLPGGAYVYQGEELGLPEVLDLPDELRQDPAFLRTNGEEGRRDGCRVPIPWTWLGSSFGFSPSGASWLPQPTDWGAWSVEAQDGDPASMLTLYRTALALRKERPDLGDGTLRWLDAPAGVLAFARQHGTVCVVNVEGEPLDVTEVVPSHRLLLASEPLDDGVLAPGAAAWLEALS
jgi:alpha-glucosidase